MGVQPHWTGIQPEVKSKYINTHPVGLKAAIKTLRHSTHQKIPRTQATSYNYISANL